MRAFKIISFSISLFLCFFSCTSEQKKEENKKESRVPLKITDTTSFKNNIYGYEDKVSGVVGVFDVPEMLVLSVMDSAESKNVSAAMVENYDILQEEIIAVGAEINGPLGMITYNNDINNFKFENVVCIKRLPKIQPKRCKIIVLEASQMLVFNFYGSYQSLFVAYDKLQLYCKKNDLEQSGPMREFYITDPAKEPDPQNWLTRIMLPVIAKTKNKSNPDNK